MKSALTVLIASLICCLPYSVGVIGVYPISKSALHLCKNVQLNLNVNMKHIRYDRSSIVWMIIKQ